MKSRYSSLRSSRTISITIFALSVTCLAEGQSANNWTNPASGNWEDTANWSLATRPGAGQSLLITNAGWKAIGINPGTVANFPASLTVSNVTVSAPAGEANTLLLNFAGTATPLQVQSGINIGPNGAMVNFSSSVLAGSNGLTVTGGQLQQSGGWINSTDSTNRLDGGCFVTNGSAELGMLEVGTRAGGQFTQYGGQVNVSNLHLGRYFNSQWFDGFYNLNGGEFRSDFTLSGAFGGNGWFNQSGGTNWTRNLRLGSSAPDDYNHHGNFQLSGGALFMDSAQIGVNAFTRGRFTQTGGICIATNALTLVGSDQSHANSAGLRSSYTNAGGLLVAREIHLLDFSTFAQSTGTTWVSSSIDMDGRVNPWSPPTQINVSGGVVGCSNLICKDAEALISGGTLFITNLLQTSGQYYPCLEPSCLAVFRSAGGILIVSNIDVQARFSFEGTSATNRIQNAGAFKLSGLLEIAGVNESLGRFTLNGSPAKMDFGTETATLRFADSRNESWSGQLWILDWAGNTNGGGKHQLYFGTNQNGLTLQQLSLIRFGHPLFQTNYARQLTTGEVVPTPTPTLLVSRVPYGVILTWPDNFILQTATNVAGPFTSQFGYTSPQYFPTQFDPQVYFRLRK